MLKIQVMGRGLIPRGQGIAPRKEPFDADLKTIQAILNAGTLKVNMVNPVTGHLVPLTSTNLKKMWAAYGNRATEPKRNNVSETVVTRPVTPEKPVDKPTQDRPREVNKNDIQDAVTDAFASIDQKNPDTSKKPDSEKKGEKEPEKKSDEKKEEPKVEIRMPGGLKPVNNPNQK